MKTIKKPSRASRMAAPHCSHSSRIEVGATMEGMGDVLVYWCPDCGALKRVEAAERRYNPAYGDDRVCECGHPYYRHFDTYDRMKAIGCKYCKCLTFKEQSPAK